jgi:hypothetical protein
MTLAFWALLKRKIVDWMMSVGGKDLARFVLGLTLGSNLAMDGGGSVSSSEPAMVSSRASRALRGLFSECRRPGDEAVTEADSDSIGSKVGIVAELMERLRSRLWISEDVERGDLGREPGLSRGESTRGRSRGEGNRLAPVSSYFDLCEWST